MSDTATTFPGLLAARAGHAAPALIDRGRHVAFDELLAQSRSLAEGLRGLGIARGDRVALWLPNLPAWLATFYACAQLGAIAISVNTRFRGHEVADILERSRARVLVLWPAYRGIDFRAILESADGAALRHLETIVAYAESGDPATAPLAGKPALAYARLLARPALATTWASPDTGCVVFTTSGTTRRPKFVLHTQRNLIAHAHDVARGFGLGTDSVMLLAPPLCGVYGFCSAMAALAAGRPLVMRPVWDPAEAASDVDAHRVTHANGTDEAFARLLEQRRDAVPFPRVRYFGYAAFTPALADIVARADARGLRLVGLYGTSEIQALVARQDDGGSVAERALAGGRMVSPEARVRARDAQSGRILAHGEPGELEFFAPASRMAEYLEDEAATQAAFTADGYYRSGDLGYTLADGRFVFLARMGDALRLGGFLVSPAEIESVVQEMPGIDACQVVGATTAQGERCVAFVTLHPHASLNETELRATLATRLARYKVPERIFAIDEFPLTPGANATKIQKGKLRQLAEQRLKQAPA